jgi:hypothetical protein
MGIVDWTESYQSRMEARAKLELAPDRNLDASKPEEKKVCDELKAKNTPILEEGYPESQPGDPTSPGL